MQLRLFIETGPHQVAHQNMAALRELVSAVIVKGAIAFIQAYRL